MKKKTFTIVSLASILLFSFLSLHGVAEDSMDTEPATVAEEVSPCPEGRNFYSCDSVEGKKRDFFCSKKKKVSEKKIAKKCSKAKKEKKAKKAKK